MITKAIIPVAGYGTRRLPITKAIEKCMLPVGNRPIVDYVVQDCVQAGIKDIIFIVSEENSQLEKYYSKNERLEEYLVKNGKNDALKLISVPDIKFHYILQNPNGKYGTSIPVSLAMPVINEGESVVVLMGDDFIYNSDHSSEVKRLIESTEDGSSSLLGVKIPKEKVSRYGVIDKDSSNNFIGIVEKPSFEEAPSDLINVSKYIMDYKLLQYIKKHADGQVDGEYLITDPINEYIKDGNNIKVVEAKGEYLDGGNLEGWLYANNVVCKDIL